MGPITIELPIYIQFGKRKKTTFSLNLNQYRNAHFQILNKAKVLFEEMVSSRIGHLPPMRKVDLTYSLFFGSRRAIDISNICCIVDKFFCDTLVNHGKLPDDNMEVISSVNYQWGEIDKHNPRIEVTLSNIEVIEEKEEPMKILLTPDEIHAAIVALVQQQIVIRDGQTVAVDMQADGSAVINIVSGSPAMTAAQAEVMTKTSAPVTSAVPKAAAVGAPKAEVPSPKSEPKVKDVPAAAPAPEAKAEAPKVEAKVEPKKEEAKAAPTPKAEPKVEAAPAAAPKAIFPSATSSAAPSTDAPKPAGKSLFANLTAPKHDTPQAPAN